MCISCNEIKLPSTNVLDMTLNCLKYSNAGHLVNVEYLFFDISPRSTLTHTGKARSAEYANFIFPEG